MWQSDNHDEVLEKTNKESTSFISNNEAAKKRTFYMKLVNLGVNVHLRQMTTLAYQPERRQNEIQVQAYPRTRRTV